jgi:hypothetical protein
MIVLSIKFAVYYLMSKVIARVNVYDKYIFIRAIPSGDCILLVIFYFSRVC